MQGLMVLGLNSRSRSSPWGYSDLEEDILFGTTAAMTPKRLQNTLSYRIQEK